MNKTHLFKSSMLILICVICIALLCSCDLISGSSEKNKSTEKVDNVVNKVTFSTLIDNYNNAQMKKSKSTADVSACVYAKNKGEVERYSAGIDFDIVRILNGDQTYVGISANPYDINEKTVGIVSGVKSLLEDSSKLKEEFGENIYDRIKDSTGQIASVLDYVHGFLLDRIDLAAEIGYVETSGSYNLKAGYDYSYKNKDGDIWYGANDDSFNKIFDVGDAMPVILGTYLSSSLYTSMVTDIENYSKDSAAKKLDGTGVGTYDLELDTNTLIDHLARYVLELFDVTIEQVSEKVDDYYSILEEVESWITVSKSGIQASTDSSMKPRKLNSNMEFSLKVNTGEVDSKLTSFYNKGITNLEQTIFIRLALSYLSDYFCDSEGNNNFLQIDFNVKVNEDISYDSSSCNLSKYDNDLFIPYDSVVEGRINITKFFNIAKLNVENHLHMVLNTLTNSDIKEEIIGKINEEIEKLDPSYELTIDELNNIIIDTLEAFEVTDEDIIGQISDIIQRIENGPEDAPNPED